MADQRIVNIVKKYLQALPAVDIHPTHAMLFGSFAKGTAHEYSDIDILIVAPEFDSPRPIPVKTAAKLWKVAREVDDRIEPIPCGAEEWQKPHNRQILDVADKNGIMIKV